MINVDSKKEHKLENKTATIYHCHQDPEQKNATEFTVSTQTWATWETRPVYFNPTESGEESRGLIDSTSSLVAASTSPDWTSMTIWCPPLMPGLLSSPSPAKKEEHVTRRGWSEHRWGRRVSGREWCGWVEQWKQWERGEKGDISLASRIWVYWYVWVKTGKTPHSNGCSHCSCRLCWFLGRLYLCYILGWSDSTWVCTPAGWCTG